MRINLGHGFTATWEHGSHYVNFNDGERDYDCVSFHWEKNTPSFMDAWKAFYHKEFLDC